jgi:hypothetical protein
MTDEAPEYQLTGDVTGGTWQLTRDGVPITGPIPYNADAGYPGGGHSIRIATPDLLVTISRNPDDPDECFVTAQIKDMTGLGCGCFDHGRNCEPPGDLCCEHCPEAAHQMGDARVGRHMADGSTCSSPDLSGFTTTYTPTVPGSAANLRDDLQQVIDVWAGGARPGQLEPDRD